jgi:hypothetical protein
MSEDPAVAAMDRTGAALLQARTLEPCRHTELIENAADRQLLLEMGKVDEAARALPRRSRWTDLACDRTGRGDLLHFRLDRIEARGWFIE